MVQFNSKEQGPTAHITVNRNRVKNYEEKVYLKDGTNFEIELFNPLKVKALVHIKIDGKSISDRGIILSPGQRAYLERWIDAPKKFKFSTYTVENSAEAREAISENGRVSICFHEEAVKNFFPGGLWNGAIATGGNTVYPFEYQYTTDYKYSSPSAVPPLGGTTNLFYNSTSIRDIDLTDSLSSSVGTLETGRAELGESSSQQFTEVLGDFNAWYSKNIEWKILPESQKPVEVSKIRSYCTKCGTRVRSYSWKFCPSCGEKV
jgi:hypothetical protein